MGLADEYVVRPAQGPWVRAFIVKYHYAQRVPLIQYSYRVNRMGESEPIGVISYGSTLGNEMSKGCDWNMLELGRVSMRENPRNLATFFIAETFKLLPKPLLFLSYADSNQGHVGYIYQAGNWIYSGSGGEPYELLVDGNRMTTRAFCGRKLKAVKLKELGHTVERIPQKKKHRYFFPLGNKREKKAMRKWIQDRFGIFPYPKGESHRYTMDEERAKKRELEKGKRKGLLYYTQKEKSE